MDDTPPDLEVGNALMLACASGDRQAFHQLYLNEAPRMLAFARRFTGESASAEDALQDTFVQVWKNANRFRRERGSARSWLYAVLRYRLLNQHRRDSRYPACDFPDQDWPDPGLSPEQCYLAGSDRKIMIECLKTLRVERRRPILMAYYMGLSYEQIADSLSVPLGTIKSRIRSGLKTLQACLQL